MRKILITGATSGFGKLLVEELLKNGDMVLASGRNLLDRGGILSDLKATYPGKLQEYTLDVTKADELKSIVRDISEQHGAIDILINNAGYGLFGALEDLKDEAIRDQMEVNFFGTLNVTKAFLPLLRISKGKIFNFSSVFGFMGFPITSVYCASKFAVEGLTESLRGELAPHGVQICLIEPGGYNTKFGNSLSWGVEDSSPYRDQVRNYQAVRVKISDGKKSQDPREVSQGLLKLSLQSKLPMRKPFGKDAGISWFLKNCLPTWLYWGIMDRVFKKVFLKKN